MENKRKFIYGALVLLLPLIILLIYFSGSNIHTGFASVKSYKEPLFQISLEIPEEYEKVLAGEKLLTSIEINNFGKVGRRDITLAYIIKDSKNNEIFKKVETVAIETDNSFVRYLDLPSDIIQGEYTVEVKLTYLNKEEANAAKSFMVLS